MFLNPTFHYDCSVHHFWAIKVMLMSGHPHHQHVSPHTPSGGRPVTSEVTLDLAKDLQVQHACGWQCYDHIWHVMWSGDRGYHGYCLTYSCVFFTLSNISHHDFHVLKCGLKCHQRGLISIFSLTMIFLIMSNFLCNEHSTKPALWFLTLLHFSEQQSCERNQT